VRWDHVAGVEVRVDSDARATGRVVELDWPGVGQEVAPRVLGVDPELDRVPIRNRDPRRELQTFAGGYLQLLGHQVHPAHHLGDGVLDLQPGVHLDEVELAA
jgi:hypothetical protein